MPVLSRLKLDPFTLLLVAAVALASLLPARGGAVPIAEGATTAAIALLFFLHGARLSREAVLAGATHWRLHLLVTASTFVLFPLLGLGLSRALDGRLEAGLTLGVLFLCLLPSTVQSSIAFTSIARGNVAAAICSATASNLLGVVLTPVLVGLLLHRQGGVSGDAVLAIVLQLLAPFVAGQLARPWIGGWLTRHARLIGRVDRSSILLVVYVAFSHAVVNGLWGQVSGSDLLLLLVVSAALLALVLASTAIAGRLFGFSRADRITLLFCGSKKSLASGVPIAGVLFPAATVGVVVLPLMLFHQLQLMVCAVLAQRFAREAEGDDAEEKAETA